MRLMRFNRKAESSTLARLGVLLPGDIVGDMRAGFARYLAQEKGDTQGREIAALRMPVNIAPFLAIGPAAGEAAQATRGYLAELLQKEPDAAGLDGQRLFAPLAECRLHATVRLTKVIAVARNYAEPGRQEAARAAMRVPSAWVKANSTIIGLGREIVMPPFVKQLDYETELAVVIGRKCKDVPESRAYDVIAGYSVMNDLGARDIVAIERKEGHQLLGKMLDTFAPLGPWLVTRDEVPDPMNLRIVTRVNGELRQEGNTRDMIWPIPKLIAYLSQMTLEPGDVISTGTPVGRRSDDPSRFLKPGDMLESEIEGIGVMRNKVVEEPAKERGWTW